MTNQLIILERKEKQREYQRQWNVNHRERIAAQRRKRYHENPEHTKIIRQAWRDKNRERINAQRRSYTQKLREQVFELLGHKCVICGFTDKRALQVDHINGGGTKERKNLRSHDNYRLVLEKNGIGYQILCANCNWIKGAVAA